MYALDLLDLCSVWCTLYSTTAFDDSIDKKAVLSQRLPCDALYSDRTIRQYAHGLLLESPFIPSSTDCGAVRAKIRQKCPSQWP